jgi:hypothetical protein
MPLPATRHALSYVDATRRKGSRSIACAHAQVRGVLRGGKHSHRHAGHCIRVAVQWRVLPALSEKPPQTPFPRQAPRLGAGQRQAPPRSRAPALAATAAQGAHAFIPASMQSRTQPNRLGLEADMPTGHTQSALSNTRRCHRRCDGALRSMGQAQSTTTETMRHYLRRYV